MRRDRRAGLNTGVLHLRLRGLAAGRLRPGARAVSAACFAEHNIHFVPGVNEDLAATSVRAARSTRRCPSPQVDGVVGIWYGKGPGVDRSGDVLRHANLAGTAKPLRRAGAGRRRPRLEKLHHPAPERVFASTTSGFRCSRPARRRKFSTTACSGLPSRASPAPGAGLKLATDVCDGGGNGRGLARIAGRSVEPEYLVDGAPYRKVMHPLLLVPASLDARNGAALPARSKRRARFARANGLNRIVDAARRRPHSASSRRAKPTTTCSTALRNHGARRGDLDRPASASSSWAWCFRWSRRSSKNLRPGSTNARRRGETQLPRVAASRDALQPRPRPGDLRQAGTGAASRCCPRTANWTPRSSRRRWHGNSWRGSPIMTASLCADSRR